MGGSIFHVFDLSLSIYLYLYLYLSISIYLSLSSVGFEKENYHQFTTQILNLACSEDILKC